MAKQQIYQQFIFKIHSTRILKSNRNLKLSIKDARQNKEIISLADSNALRMIDIINKCDRDTLYNNMKQYKSEIKQLKKQPKSKNTCKKIKQLYDKLDNIQFKSDYVSIIMDNDSDIDRLDKGFKINNVFYRRLVGTTNGIKKNTIVYASISNSSDNNIYSDLTNRMNNGRNEKIPLVAGKFEAYKSLTCSASVPVSCPNGILVVDDLTVICKEKVINLSGAKDGNVEPIFEESENEQEVEIIDSDGYGLICPRLSKRWAVDTLVDYIPSGFCIRNSFCKGMVFTFDFHDFAMLVAHRRIVKDIWGEEHNIDNIELILTTSMLKLWDCYDNINDYLENCNKNDYTFAVTKICPKELENERNMNYQFLQSYHFTDDEIKELLSPTINEIKSVINGDIDKTILFLKGAVCESENLLSDNDYIIQSLLINPEMANDPYIINRVHNMIKKKINDAKIGVIKVHGNYAVISGDPYALCQHIFECDIDNDNYGLLRRGQVYSKKWLDNGSEKIVCFRAPMSVHSNIRVMNVVTNDDMNYWYKYMSTVNILNCHDSTTAALNGADKDGDCIITTDNPIILKNTKNSKTIICSQNKAEKVIISDDNLRQSNKNGFGDDIGKITNRITAMYDVQSKFSENSKEYKILDYRIMCGQLLQQDAIDKVKGIISKPMPKFWYNNKLLSIDKEKDSPQIISDKKFNLSILANKKPYFMCYIYPQDMALYKNFVDNSETKCLIMFNKSIHEIIHCENITKEEQKFLNWYNEMMPYGLNNCTMNKICWYVEKEFDGYLAEIKGKNNFNYIFMKQGIEYSQKDFNSLKNIYLEYMQEMHDYSTMSNKYRIDSEEVAIQKNIMKNKYKIECDKICGVESVQCDILLDLCYKSEKSKKFVWDMCGSTIVDNLLKDNDNIISYYIKNGNGNIEYCGEMFEKKVKEVML